MAPKCASCGKTAYPMESIVCNEATYHKGCFRCEGEEDGVRCTQRLQIKTVKTVGTHVYCPKHAPVDKPSGAVDMTMQNAMMSPRRDLVNTNKRGDNMEKPLGATADGDLATINAKRSHDMVQLVNEQCRAGHGERGTQAVDMTTANAMKAPKLDTVNEQARGTGERGTQAMDMTTANALKAPKADTVNDQVRGAGERGTQAMDMTTANALKAPKAANTVNDQIRGTGDAPTAAANVY